MWKVTVWLLTSCLPAWSVTVSREGVRTAKHVAQRERIPGTGQAVDPLAVEVEPD